MKILSGGSERSYVWLPGEQCKAAVILLVVVLILGVFAVQGIRYLRYEGTCLRNGYERVIFYYGDPYCFGVTGEPVLAAVPSVLAETAP